MLLSQPEELTIPTPRIDIGALAWGDAQSRPVLTLHGWLDNAASYIPMAPYLTDYRIVAIDMPGHGASGHRPPGIPYYFVDYVADIINAVDALGWDEFDLIGHSLGGAVATFVAALMPQRISKLTLIEGLGPLVRDPKTAPDTMLKALEQMKQHEERTATRKPVIYPDPQRAVDARAKIGDISDSSARVLVMRNMRETEGGWQWRSDPRLRHRSPMYLTEEQVMAYVERIESKTLLIRGTESGFAGRDIVVARQGLVRDLTIVDLPGEHHLHMEDPERVAAVINDFLQ